MTKSRAGMDNFLAMCFSAENEKMLSLLLELFLTADEMENVAMRFLIVEELIKSQKTQRQIAKDLNVSIAKITRGSNELKRINRKLLTYLKEKILV